MKRVLLVVALCVTVSGAFAQKKAVNQAQSIAKSNRANYEEARGLIQGALNNPETKDQAKTWYVAGYVEDQQFNAERTKQMLGQQANEVVMYQALMNTLPYFLKAYDLDQLPDAKGKVKQEVTKDIKNILTANHVSYINAGAYYFDNRDYQKAYDAFEEFLKISDLPMFAGERVAERDSNFMSVQFYAALAATQLEKPDVAIAALERAKSSTFRTNDVYQYLAYEYQQLGDTVKWERTLEEGLQKFPQEKYFLMNLINNYIYSNRNEQAIDYLNKAIADDPNNAEFYNVLGYVYDSGIKDFDKAEIAYMKALEIDPNNTDAMYNLGRVYYNQGVIKQGEANDITDNAKYQEELAKAKALFNKALPYFEKVEQIKPDDREILVALRGIYYNLNMGDKYEAIEAKLQQ